MSRLYRGLYVLRIMILASDDDQVFEAPGNEEVAVANEAEVSRAQEGTVRGITQVSLKGRPGFFGMIVVPRRDAWATHPNLAHATGGATGQGTRINDDG